jgi:hypothetical protein
LFGIRTTKHVLRSGTTRDHIARNITMLRFPVGIYSSSGSHWAIQARCAIKKAVSYGGLCGAEKSAL